MKILFLIAILISFSLAFAESDHDHEEDGKRQGTSTGKDHEDDHHGEQKLPGGVTFFDDEAGEFSLKEKVIKNFGIETQAPVRSGAFVELPERSIVRSLKETSIFIFENGKFKSIPVKVMSVSERGVRASVERPFTRVVVKGNNFLQTILLSLEEGPSEGHGH